MSTEYVVFELGVEELPAAQLNTMQRALQASVEKALRMGKWQFSVVRPIATPRRIGFGIESVQMQQDPFSEEVKGPPCDAPEQAAKGFAKKLGLNLADLQRKSIAGKAYYFGVKQVPSVMLAGVLPAIIDEALHSLPIPKKMRWGSSKLAFLRPVRWAFLQVGAKPVHAVIMGMDTLPHSYGHRFHHPGKVFIAHAQSYFEQLMQAYVVADPDERTARIRQQLGEIEDNKAVRVVIEQDLLEEVSALVEWPVAIMGEFPTRFLDLPEECLISTMKSNQKYFHVRKLGEGALLPYFVTIANIQSREPDKIIHGNERVIIPRFEDAAFFYQNDIKQQLEDYAPGLKEMVFEHSLGSIADKVERVTAIAVALVKECNIGNEAHIERSAQLCKCDLLSDMVGEFPSLQGIMGRYYAQYCGEDKAVADAIEEHYKPRFAGDDIAFCAEGRILAIADKMDTICGIFSIGKQPTSERDPFALRRGALGVIRTIVEAQLPIDWLSLVEQIVSIYERRNAALFENRDDKAEVIKQIRAFMQDRFIAYYANQGWRVQTIRGVLGAVPSPSNFFDAYQRLDAVCQFEQLPEAKILSDMAKRIDNILKQAADMGTCCTHTDIDEKRLEKVEKDLLDKVCGVEYAFSNISAGWSKRLELLVGIAPKLSDFFDQVMVFDEDEVVRTNRLALLHRTQDQMRSVVDASALQL